MHTELEYLDAVLKETLRLHPPILELHHVVCSAVSHHGKLLTVRPQAAKSQTLPLSEPLPGTSIREVPVPKGTILAVPVNVVQQDPAVWGPDAHLFRPERWLELRRQGPGSAKAHAHELLSFSRGPRMCLGRVFADVEIKALLVTLVRQFEFAPLREIEAFQSFVIRPRVKGELESTLPLRVSLVRS